MLIGICSFLIDDCFNGYLITHRSISNKLFYNCNNWQKVIIPSLITSIGDLAFENCSSMKEIVLGPFLQSIGSNSFSGCSSLSEIEIEMPSYVSYRIWH